MEREVRRRRGGRVGREKRKDMDVTKIRRCLRGCSVRRAKVESLMNNFTITV